MYVNLFKSCDTRTSLPTFTSKTELLVVVQGVLGNISNCIFIFGSFCKDH